MDDSMQAQIVVGAFTVALNAITFAYVTWRGWKRRSIAGIAYLEAAWLFSSLLVWGAWLLHAIGTYDFPDDFLGLSAHFVWLMAFPKSIALIHWLTSNGYGRGDGHHYE